MEEREVFFNIKMIVNTFVLFFPNSCLLYSSIGVGKKLILWATFFFHFHIFGKKGQLEDKDQNLGDFYNHPSEWQGSIVYS